MKIKKGNVFRTTTIQKQISREEAGAPLVMGKKVKKLVTKEVLS